jgi:hypothetical protein
MPKGKKRPEAPEVAAAPKLNALPSVVQLPVREPVRAPHAEEKKARFKCWLGHVTFGPASEPKILCRYCAGYASLETFKAEDLCLCGDRFCDHKPYCLPCGVTDDGTAEGKYVQRCATFAPMS